MRSRWAIPRDWAIALGTAFVISAVIVGSLIAITLSNDRRTRAVATAALPSATAYLKSDPAYSDVSVKVSGHHGGGLWFTGSVPDQKTCDRLEAELAKRYHAPDYEFMFSVVPQNL